MVLVTVQQVLVEQVVSAQERDLVFPQEQPIQLLLVQVELLSQAGMHKEMMEATLSSQQ